MSISPSHTFSQALKITPLMAEKLARTGVCSDTDLLLHIPLRYEDETRITPVADVRLGEFAQVQVTVIEHEVKFRPRRQLVVTTQDNSGEVLVLRYVNFYPSMLANFRSGQLLRVKGEARHGFFGTEMIHPRVEKVTENTPVAATLTPIYPTVEGLPQSTWRKLIARALEVVVLPEILPAHILNPDWGTLMDAVRLLHAPPPDVNPHALTERDHIAWGRLKFEELLAQQISIHQARMARRLEVAPALVVSGGSELGAVPAQTPSPPPPLPPFRERGENQNVLAQFIAQLPFKLTGAQQSAWQLIAQDMGTTTPMHRLLQGDVGSGKTVVAALACAQCVDAGKQCAVMAPTEILAEQLYYKLHEWFTPLNVNVAWLASSVTKKNKQSVYDALEKGEVHILVGTHALIQESVRFYDLGLAVIDEQHRFGVKQRLALRTKMKESVCAINDGQEHAPHQLMMSATPIPRTLALSYFADLDVAVIDELPPNRTPIVTKLIDVRRRAEVVAKVAQDVAQGKQIYWVCPLIEESETLELKTAIETFDHLTAALTDARVGLVHGRLKPAEKRAVMEAFKACELDVLVATTVIEVGVDVPNASVMVIEHAERFGLAQLHQLRGRVGRGAVRSQCILLFETPLSDIAKERLKVMYETTDGFEVARRDLQLRGAGEFLGVRQSGLPLLRFADLETDTALLEDARDAAAWLLAHDHTAAEAHLLRWLGNRAELLTV
ncbi:MAG: ATP-dependent DNA helicase RecG [Burkholderiales bacterium]|nr:ATP-dependent DNA helicase RecG [Burkholderiales bacterium]